MSHMRADSKARQRALDEMFTAITDLEGVVTETVARDQRFAAVDGERAKATRNRFQAFGGAR